MDGASPACDRPSIPRKHRSDDRIDPVPNRWFLVDVEEGWEGGREGNRTRGKRNAHFVVIGPECFAHHQYVYIRPLRSNRGSFRERSSNRSVRPVIRVFR